MYNYHEINQILFHNELTKSSMQKLIKIESAGLYAIYNRFWLLTHYTELS